MAYAIQENTASGDWWDGDRFTPCSDRAMTWDDEDDAEDALRGLIEESVRVAGMIRVVGFDD